VALLAGCTHLGTVDGAIPLPMGANDFTGEIQVTRSPNLVSTPTGFPLPSFAAHWRHGLSDDMDLGIHIYPLGLGADLRYRFAELDGWHFAFAPGFAGMVIPLTSFRYGQLDLSFPVRAERLVGKGWSIAGGPGLVARQTFLGVDADALSTATATFELYAGGGCRLQHLGKRLKLGVSADLYVDTTRATGLYGGLGFDLGTVAHPRARKVGNEIGAAPSAGTR
jgi:hypothetical protein